MWRNQNPHTLLLKMWNGAATAESSLAVPPKVKYRVTIWSSNSTPRYIPKRNETPVHTKTCTQMFHNSENNPNVHQLINEWINIVVCIHLMEHYPPIKRNEILIHATTWMNLENIMLSETRSYKRPHIIWFLLYEMSRIGKFIETKSRWVATRSWGCGREWGMTAKWVRGFFLGWWKCSGIIYWCWLYNTVNGLKLTELYTLKLLKWGLPWWRSG